MIISKTPFRVSFFGGGSDYPAWYLEEGGQVLSTTIDKYCYISCRHFPPFFTEKHRVVWSHIEGVSSINEILHPAVREGLKYMGYDDRQGIEIHHQGDLPARAGMASSSAFSVGLIHALSTLRGNNLSKHELALKAIELEQVVLKEFVGSQDQVAVAYGGLNLIKFNKNGKIQVQPVGLSSARVAELESHLMLFYTGTSRLSSVVAETIIANMTSKKKTLKRMCAMVDEAYGILTSTEPISAFGELLDEAWSCKRGLSARVTSAVVDEVYTSARAAGAVGGKLLGAGGSGFMLLFVPPEKQEDVRQALNGYLHVPFMFEYSGSVILDRTSSNSSSPVIAPAVRRPREGAVRT